MTGAESGVRRRRFQVGASGPHSEFGVDKASDHHRNRRIQATALRCQWISGIPYGMTCRCHGRHDIADWFPDLRAVQRHRLGTMCAPRPSLIVGERYNRVNPLRPFSLSLPGYGGVVGAPAPGPETSTRHGGKREAGTRPTRTHTS